MRPLRAARTVLVGIVVVGSAAACGGAAATPPSLAPSAVTATAVATTAAPTSFADWTARQGFGGSSGLNNVEKLAGWLVEHRSDAKLFDLDSDVRFSVALVDWLDAHPATACWKDYHAKVRASLQRIVAGYADARAAVADGEPVPVAVATALQAEAEAASSIPAPADCP